MPFFDEVFAQLGCTVSWHSPEGAALAPVAHAATVRGPARQLLLGERVALNTLARCSGIATQTARTVAQVRAAAEAAGVMKPPIVAGTRKTTPGFRRAEKYAMVVGGADPHRHDLSAMVMIKDNHAWLAAMNRRRQKQAANGDAATNGDAAATSQGASKSQSGDEDGESLAAAVRATKAAAGFAVKVEVECGSLEMASAAVGAGADVVMLDNMGPEEIAAAATQLRQRHASHGREFLVEVSGGLTEENISAYARGGVDILSTSSIHQGVKHVDFSLKIVH